MLFIFIFFIFYSYFIFIIIIIAVAAPSLWNTLPSEIRNAQSVSVFKRRLKTLLFRKAFYN